MHNAKLETSDRLKRLHEFLVKRGEHGATTAEIQEETRSQAVHSDVSELRACGYDIHCAYVGTNEAGRKVYLYRLRGRRSDAA
jgi:hypothetical protein